MREQFKKLNKAKAYQLLNINALQNAMEEMHKDVQKAVRKNRAKQIELHHKNTNIVGEKTFRRAI